MQVPEHLKKLAEACPPVRQGAEHTELQIAAMDMVYWGGYLLTSSPPSVVLLQDIMTRMHTALLEELIDKEKLLAEFALDL